MHCTGHPKAGTLEAKGNRKADEEAQWAAMATLPSTVEALAMPLLPEIPSRRPQATLQMKEPGLPQRLGITLEEGGENSLIGG